MSEAVVFVSQHRNEYNSKSKTNGNFRFRSFGSPPFRGVGYQDFNFRYIDSSNGILPTPIKSFSENVTEISFSPKTPSLSVNELKNSKKFAINSSFPTPMKVFSAPVTKQSFSPKTPSPSVGEPKHKKKFTNSRSTPIPIKINADFNEMFFSERWAGPTYSNSPPASSLPMPRFSKFSSRPNRTASLDLPSSSAPGFRFISLAKSAPVSPSRDCNSPFSVDFHNSDESATKTLRRILNLDSEDE